MDKGWMDERVFCNFLLQALSLLSGGKIKVLSPGHKAVPIHVLCNQHEE